MKNRICVLGGMNMDITGAPHASLCPGDSNPGTVRMTPGGVGRNIAENLARMGFQVELVAPLGNDGFATLLRQACMQDGIGLSLAPSLPMASSVYLCLMDGRGDMYAAVNDMALCES
ncbi:MAG: PfkB family carbohydrate kinase, partial [Christensenellales bacterium]|nr:PfkB family carbohydrate kinase [Christensenellales bacterium]